MHRPGVGIGEGKRTGYSRKPPRRARSARLNEEVGSREHFIIQHRPGIGRHGDAASLVSADFEHHALSDQVTFAGPGQALAVSFPDAAHEFDLAGRVSQSKEMNAERTHL